MTVLITFKSFTIINSLEIVHLVKKELIKTSKNKERQKRCLKVASFFLILYFGFLLKH